MKMARFFGIIMNFCVLNKNVFVLVDLVACAKKNKSFCCNTAGGQISFIYFAAAPGSNATPTHSCNKFDTVKNITI